MFHKLENHSYNKQTNKQTKKKQTGFIFPWVSDGEKNNICINHYIFFNLFSNYG